MAAGSGVTLVDKTTGQLKINSSNGQTLQSNGTNDQCCCGGSGGGVCGVGSITVDDPSLLSSYTVASPSGTCPTAKASTDPVWDGSVGRLGLSYFWSVDNYYAPSHPDLSINGQWLGNGYTRVELMTDPLDASISWWELTIEVLTPGGTAHPTLWHGCKNTGGTPVGTYTLNSGCSTDATVTIS